jgi:predicted dinucleotide-binding enzyme
MRIGIIGAGMIGATMARLWAQAGHEVKISSRHPEALRDLARSLGSNASAGTPREAAAFGEVVLLTVPLKAVPGLAEDLGSLLDGTIVLDTGNAYQGRDGAVAREAEHHPRGSAGWAAALFPGARWVKALNTVYFKTLETEAHKVGDQVGVPLASDDRAAMDVAAQLVLDAGFDPVVVGSLARGKEFEPGTRVYNTGMKGPDVRRVLGIHDD